MTRVVTKKKPQWRASMDGMLRARLYALGHSEPYGVAVKDYHGLREAMFTYQRHTGAASITAKDLDGNRLAVLAFYFDD